MYMHKMILMTKRKLYVILIPTVFGINRGEVT